MQGWISRLCIAFFSPDGLKRLEKSNAGPDKVLLHCIILSRARRRTFLTGESPESVR